ACSIHRIVPPASLTPPLHNARPIVGARGPYPAWHTEIMHADDAAAIDALGDGTVLALPPASDAIVSRRGIPVVFGIGTFNLTDRLYLEVKDAAETFFDPRSEEHTSELQSREN